MDLNNILKGFQIVKAVNMLDSVNTYARQGALKGKFLGFPTIQQNYTMSLPGVTDWTGFPTSGKTQVLMEFLLNTSEFYGWKHLVYFPDVGNATEILADLIHKRTGKTFDKRYKNHITEMEIAIELTWICEHFKILTKKDLKQKITPYQFWDLAVKMKDEMGIQTASIDAWKDMKHDITGFGRDDKYLEDVLSYRNAIADKHKMHFHTIIHPTRTDKDSAGNRKPPTPYDLKGGTEWFNNGRNMVTVHRPSGEANKVELHWNKIKPRSIGKVGISELYFDMEKFRYYNDENGSKVFASAEYKKPEKEIEKEKVQSITDDDGDELPF